jgi:protein-S-isoprenylcysteine O-methyltransferase Ste14
MFSHFPMATTEAILLYVVALLLTVVTLWIVCYAIQTLSPNEFEDPGLFLILILVIVPFVMLIYFGLAVIIDDRINMEPGTALPLRPSLTTITTAVAVLTYCGLSRWLWFRWRKAARVRKQVMHAE